MDMQYYYNQFENCLQDEKAFCSDDCPFGMDVLDFETKMEAGRYNAAYKIFRNAVAFPAIIAEICSQYCTERCPRRDFGGAIQINKLEKTCLHLAKRQDPNEYNLPTRKGKVAIIGAGLSGLSCAIRLASKKYDVTVYEKSDFIGGAARSHLSNEFIEEEVSRQFKYENYTLIKNREITDIFQLVEDGFDAIYVATGNEGEDFALHTKGCEADAKALDNGCEADAKALDNGNSDFCALYVLDNNHALCHGTTAVYGGGGLMGRDIIQGAADGLNIAREIESFLKTGIARRLAITKKTKLEPHSISDLEAASATPYSEIKCEDELFTAEEAKIEISRCLRCKCDSCRTHCDLTAYFDKWPLQMRDDIMTTTMPANSMIRKAPAIRLINMCTQCGLCAETCPGQIELGAMIKEARRMMHKIDRMPAAFHQFWVRDMEFANGDYCSLTKCPPEKSSCSFAFFPGCHLGAANPEYVEKAYEKLLKINDDTGILLRCCGIPADWAGNEEYHNQEIESLKEDWTKLGKPTLITACPSCMKHLKEYLPEIPLVSIYEVFNGSDVFSCNEFNGSDVFSVFDPCAARGDDEMQAAVRDLIKHMGINFEELPCGDTHGCCGFGGNSGDANPKMAAKIANERSGLSSNPYITYCINCRDVFHDNNKRALHILDLLLDIKPAGDSLPTMTQRRCNRVILKENLLNKNWSETMMNKPKLKYPLIIGPEIEAKLNSLKILHEDVCYVLEMGEVHGRKVYNPQSESYKCYREIGKITCWVEYRPSNDGFEILNVYTHRMKIELEVVFNGKKTDFDLR